MRCKRDQNLVTPLMTKWELERIQREKGFVAIPNDTVMFHVAIFKPHQAVDSYTKAMEIICLGHQTLADLKDTIYCIQDKMLIGPKMKNCYIFIEDTFFDDVRHKDCERLSQPVVDWVKNKGRYAHTGLNRFGQDDMSDVRIQDL